MKKSEILKPLLLGVACWTMTALATPARADAIADLFVTGSGGIVGLPDLHYTLIQKPAGAPATTVISSTVSSSWITSPNASWIGVTPNANVGEPVGTYIFRLSFDLVNADGVALDPDSVTLRGAFAMDDGGTLLLNGVAQTNSISLPGSPSFSLLTAFTLDSGFVEGVNTLDFEVFNIGNQPSPVGLLVSKLHGSATPVPEPGTIGLASFGGLILLASGLIRRDRPQKK